MHELDFIMIIIVVCAIGWKYQKENNVEGDTAEDHFRYKQEIKQSNKH